MKLFLLFLIMSSTHAWDYQGEIGIGSTTFSEKDQNSDNQDQQSVIETSWKFQNRAEKIDFQIEFLARIDANDSERNLMAPLDTFIRYSGEKNSASFGSHIFNWSVLEIFHPVDTINSHNLDIQGEKLERLGQPSLVLTRENQGAVYQFIYLVNQVDPKLPSSQNRIGLQFDFDSPRYAVGDEKHERWPVMPQYGVRIKKLYEPLEVDFQLFRKYATHLPFFVVPDQKIRSFDPEQIAEDISIRPTYFPMTQSSLALTTPLWESMFKLELAYYDFDNLDYEQLTKVVPIFFPPSLKTETQLLRPLDYGVVAMGLEYTYYYSNGQEGTFIVEHQLLWDLPAEKARIYSIFQNDLGLGYRHNFNDFNSWDIVGSYIIDSYEPKQSIFNLSSSFRFYQDYKFESALRVINSPNKELELIKPQSLWGLRPFRLSDNIQFKITRYF